MNRKFTLTVLLILIFCNIRVVGQSSNDIDSFYIVEMNTKYLITYQHNVYKIHDKFPSSQTIILKDGQYAKLINTSNGKIYTIDQNYKHCDRGPYVKDNKTGIYSYSPNDRYLRGCVSGSNGYIEDDSILIQIFDPTEAHINIVELFGDSTFFLDSTHIMAIVFNNQYVELESVSSKYALLNLYESPIFVPEYDEYDLVVLYIVDGTTFEFVKATIYISDDIDRNEIKARIFKFEY